MCLLLSLLVATLTIAMPWERAVAQGDELIKRTQNGRSTQIDRTPER
jgi:hypothetical protein